MSNDSSLKRLLRQASKHCPGDLRDKIDTALGPQPAESRTIEDLRACLVEAVDARDFSDALEFAQRLANHPENN